MKAVIRLFACVSLALFIAGGAVLLSGSLSDRVNAAPTVVPIAEPQGGRDFTTECTLEMVYGQPDNYVGDDHFFTGGTLDNFLNSMDLPSNFERDEPHWYIKTRESPNCTSSNSSPLLVLVQIQPRVFRGKQSSGLSAGWQIYSNDLFLTLPTADGAEITGNINGIKRTLNSDPETLNDVTISVVGASGSDVLDSGADTSPDPGAGSGGTPTVTLSWVWKDINTILRISGSIPSSGLGSSVSIVETYTLEQWQGNNPKYYLANSTLPGRTNLPNSASGWTDESGNQKDCRPFLQFTSGSSTGLDLNFNSIDATNFKNLDERALNNVSTGTFHSREELAAEKRCKDVPLSDSERSVTPGLRQNKRIFFRYYPSSQTVQAILPNPGGNERPFMGPYVREGDSNVFKLAVEGCTTAPPSITFSGDTLPLENQIHNATWFLRSIPGCGNEQYTIPTGQSVSTHGVRIIGAPADEVPPAVGGNTGADADSDPAAAEEDNSCLGNSGILGWVLCPVAELLDGVLGYLDNQIEIKLLVREEYYRNEDLRQAWAVVRNIAYAILVPIMLVMVIGTALGIEIFSAYTIKKALPRMVIAVIFITLSWYICAFLVEFFNVMGAGIRGLVTNPFGISQEGGAIQTAIANANLSNSGHSGVWGGLSGTRDTLIVGVVAVGGSIAFMYLAAAMLMSMLGTAVLVLGIALIILLARQMFIIAAILLAPLAILSWIFPGNDKLWKLWWNMFSKLLMIFPMIMLLIGLGQIFGKLAGDIGGDSDNLIRAITVIGAVIIPYAAIPFTFKWAGGVFGNLAGMVNDKNKGMLDRLKKGRAEKRGQAWNSFKSGTGTGFGQKNALARGLGTRIGAGAGGGKGVYGFGAKGKARMDQMNRENAVSQVMKNPAWNGVNQDDNALHAGILLQDMDKKAAIAALTDPNGEHRLEAAEAERAVAAWQASGLGGRAAAIAAAQQLVSTGTGYRNLQHMTRTLARAAGGNTSTATALAGFANSETKRAGRHDLAPGFDTANRLTRSWMDGRGGLSDLSTVSQADWDGAHGRAWRSGSLYEHANDKPANLENHIGHFQRQLQESLANGDEAGRDEALVFFEELRAMKPNAKGENSAIINRTLNGSGDAGNPSAGDLVEQAYASMATTSETTEEVDTGIVDPSTGQTIRRTQTNTTSDGGAAARQRILGQSRSYERPDQNRLADPGAPTPQPRP